MPRPRSLEPDHLARAALAVIDRDGLGGLTMRTTARELGLSTMGIYRYVADRDELELLVTEWILRDLDTGAPDDPEWTDQLRTLCHRARAVMIGHPQAVPLMIANRQRSGHLLRWAETVLTVLTGAGFTGAGRVIALRGLAGYLNGALLQEHLGPLAGAGTDVIAALPAAEFPLMSETARAARSVPADDEFAGGLDLVLRGLSDVLAQAVGDSPARTHGDSDQGDHQDR